VQIIIQGNNIVAVYESNVDIRPNVELKQIVCDSVRTISTFERKGEYSESRPLDEYNTPETSEITIGLKNVNEAFTFDELRLMFLSGIRKYYGWLITDEYPVYKQLNIMRLATGYTQADLDEMNAFIDDNRNHSNAKETTVQNMPDTNIDDLITFDIYS
jgi:hypothetical protein